MIHSPAMNCYSCEQPAINACKRCARAYCGEHGGATYCAGCLHPASALFFVHQLVQAEDIGEVDRSLA